MKLGRIKGVMICLECDGLTNILVMRGSFGKRTKYRVVCTVHTPTRLKILVVSTVPALQVTQKNMNRDHLQARHD